MLIKKKNICIIIPNKLDVNNRIIPGEIEDIYTASWINYASNKCNVYINSDPTYFNSLENSSAILIGKIPHFWPENYKKMISGFTHIIIDKYLFQSARFNLYMYQVSDVAFLLKKIYRSFKPKKVVVNNELMQDDFQKGFDYLGWDIEVKKSFHPITNLSIEKSEYVKGNRKG